MRKSSDIFLDYSQRVETGGKKSLSGVRGEQLNMKKEKELTILLISESSGCCCWYGSIICDSDILVMMFIVWFHFQSDARPLVCILASNQRVSI